MSALVRIITIVETVFWVGIQAVSFMYLLYLMLTTKSSRSR